MERAAKMFGKLGLDPPTATVSSGPPKHNDEAATAASEVLSSLTSSERNLIEEPPRIQSILPDNEIPSSETKVAAWTLQCSQFAMGQQPARVRRVLFGPNSNEETEYKDETNNSLPSFSQSLKSAHLMTEPPTSIAPASPKIKTRTVNKTETSGHVWDDEDDKPLSKAISLTTAPAGQVVNAECVQQTTSILSTFSVSEVANLHPPSPNKKQIQTKPRSNLSAFEKKSETDGGVWDDEDDEPLLKPTSPTNVAERVPKGKCVQQTKSIPSKSKSSVSEAASLLPLSPRKKQIQTKAKSNTSAPKKKAEINTGVWDDEDDKPLKAISLTTATAGQVVNAKGMLKTKSILSKFSVNEVPNLHPPSPNKKQIQTKPRINPSAFEKKSEINTEVWDDEDDEPLLKLNSLLPIIAKQGHKADKQGQCQDKVSSSKLSKSVTVDSYHLNKKNSIIKGENSCLRTANKEPFNHHHTAVNSKNLLLQEGNVNDNRILAESSLFNSTPFPAKRRNVPVKSAASSKDKENTDNFEVRSTGPTMSNVSFSVSTISNSTLISHLKKDVKNLEDEISSFPPISWKWPSQRGSLSQPRALPSQVSDDVFKVPTPKDITKNTSKFCSSDSTLVGAQTRLSNRQGNSKVYKESTDITTPKSVKPGRKTNQDNAKTFMMLSTKLTPIETPQRCSSLSKKCKSSSGKQDCNNNSPEIDLGLSFDLNDDLDSHPLDLSNISFLSNESHNESQKSAVLSRTNSCVLGEKMRILHLALQLLAISFVRDLHVSKFMNRKMKTVEVDDNDDVEWVVGDLVREDCPRTRKSKDQDSGSDEDDVVVTLPKTAKKRKWQKKLKPRSAIIMEMAASWGTDPVAEVFRTPAPVPPIAESLLEPHEYFQHFFSDDLLEKVVEFTNIFSTFKSDGKKSINLTLSELKKFFGIWMYMGITRLPAMRDYWASETQVPQVSKVMTFNRFQSIRSSLHFYDKSQEDSLDPTDRFAKVRLLLNHMKEKCNDLHQGSCYSIDETMVPYKGKFAGSLRQFIKNKPIRFGIKLFQLAGSDGIVYDFLPYAGSQTFRGISFSAEENLLGVGVKIVSHLARSIDNPSEKALYFDNYFSSPALVKHLKEKLNLVSTGTIKSNRVEHCPLISDKALIKSGRGSLDSKPRDGIAIVKWFDNTIVHMISSQAGVEPLGSARRYHKETRKPLEVPMPRLVQVYNANMGGVDLSDMLVELHRSPTKARRWYICLVGYMMDLAAVNSWFLYRRHAKSLQEQDVEEEEHEDEDEERDEEGKKKLIPCSKAFKLRICMYLMGQGTLASVPTGPKVNKLIKAPRSQRPMDTVRHDRVDHWPTFKTTQGRCKYCGKGFTTVCCVKCNEVNLCFVPTRQCFLKFHLPEME